MVTKILICGGARGQLRALFAQTAALQKAKDFNFSIVVGDLFDGSDNNDVESLLDGSLEVPLPTYFTVGSKPMPPRIAAKFIKDEEIAPNLRFLPTRSIVKTLEGIRIGTLGGRFNADLKGLTKDKLLPFHSAEDTLSLKGANSVDILLTPHTWPHNIWDTCPRPPSEQELSSVETSPALAELCQTVKPLYILSAAPGDFFYERTPFYHEYPGASSNHNAVTVCRFLALAAFNNPAKAKALYAFTLPASKLSIGAATSSPFALAARQPKRRSDNEDNKSGAGHDAGHGRSGKRRRGADPITPRTCFFCLGNNAVNEHMVVSIGNSSYLATAKGPLPPPPPLTVPPFPATAADRCSVPSTVAATNETDSKGDTAKFPLPYPGHMLIIPVEHVRNVGAIPRGDAAREVFAEMTRFRTALESMITRRSRGTLGSVTFELNVRQTVHVHWQFVPLPSASILGGLVEAAFRVEAKNQEMDIVFREVTDPKLVTAVSPFVDDENDEGGDAGHQRPFFRMWLHAEQNENRPNEDSNRNESVQLHVNSRNDRSSGGRLMSKLLVADLSQLEASNVPFFKFPRHVLAMLMELEQREEWQRCTQSADEERRDVERFREHWHDWDFTLAEG